ncbi:NmrA family NAD(P)-binding protein [Catalinimonas sp. 4WD22]|uniref:NmrA family NAD(P)-binding protein n=1 Tax=Catalinimonas locisalis TaxID=3133978 RepID=UPI0031016DA9
MENILITGATGNVGQAILHHFTPKAGQKLYLASRKAGENQRYFDFEDPEGTKSTLAQTDTLFLLRPPQISDVKKYFEPLISHAKEAGVRHIIFLSVQGAEDVSFIPHAKIEKLIQASGIAYTFIRPSYFMQNLSTTLLQDIKEQDRIFLPAGKAKFLWIDVMDIGKAIAAILQDVAAHRNQAYTITGNELYNFEEVAQMLSEVLDRKIDYISPNLLQFYLSKKKEGIKSAFIFVMIMLHFLPRFQKAPKISPDLSCLSGDIPLTLRDFIVKNKEVWQ